MRIARNRFKGRQCGKGRRAHHTDGVPRYTRAALAKADKLAEHLSELMQGMMMAQIADK
jgi:hypothetical protein